MPTYNCELYIEKSICSVIEQSYKVWELIIINDGSTDNTLNLCKKYTNQDSRIKVFSQNNKGVSVARNEGINIATGKYISFLDSDDTYHEDFLFKLINAVVKDNNFDISYCGFDRYINNVFSCSSEQHFEKGKIIKNYLLFLMDQKHFLSICSILIDLDFLKQKNIKFSIGKTNGEDTAFLIKILSNANVNFVGENLFHYHLGRENSATNNNPTISAISILDCYTDAYNFLLDNNIEKEITFYAKKLIKNELKYWLKYSIKKKNYNLFMALKKYDFNRKTLPWSIWILFRPLFKLYLKLKP